MTRGGSLAFFQTPSAWMATEDCSSIRASRFLLEIGGAQEQSGLYCRFKWAASDRDSLECVYGSDKTDEAAL